MWQKLASFDLKAALKKIAIPSGIISKAVLLFKCFITFYTDTYLLHTNWGDLKKVFFLFYL